MHLPDCLPHLAGLVVERAFVLDDTLHVDVAVPAPCARCPDCGALSHRVHSAYRRRVADLPFGGRRVAIRRRVRRFRCRHGTCPRLSPDRWPIVAADAHAFGLRQAAWQHGVSHETVRQIVLRVVASASTVPLG